MWWRSAVALSLLLAALPAGPARADDACAADAAKVCAGIPAGEGRVYYCLRSNWSRLSEGCQKTLDWSRQVSQEVALDCQADAFSWCQGVPAGRGRLFACLASHRADLSSTCRDAMSRVDAFVAACSADASRLCAGIPKGEGAVLACLVSQPDKLSPGCRAIFWP
ncbi:MAG TPA: cysteine rich repeat-containing protein [Anaeromyxobacteraceae bacterium]|nr:cysteine rich repeat-containing protein [Anaeromyxobacteraceae bacterium]